MKIKKLFALSFVAVGITALASCGDKQFTEEDVNNKVNEAVDKANQEAQDKQQAALKEKEEALNKAALASAKETAKSNIDSFKTNILIVADLEDVENEDIDAAVSTAKTAVEAATTTLEVATAYQDGINAIQKLVSEILKDAADEEASTAAQQAAILAAAKTKTLAELTAYNTADRYYINTTDDGTIANIISIATDSINEAGSVEGLAKILTTTKAAMDAGYKLILENSYVLVSTADELVAAVKGNSDHIIARNIKLSKDIDFSEATDAVTALNAENTEIFSGIFNGNGKKITNLNLTPENNKRGLLFQNTTNAIINNLTLQSCSISGNLEGLSLFAGTATNTTFDNIELYNCSIDTGGQNYAGFFAGRKVFEGVKLTNITVKGSSSLTTKKYGGALIGNNDGAVENDTFYFENLDVDFSVNSKEGDRSGALIGRTDKCPTAKFVVKNSRINVSHNTVNDAHTSALLPGDKAYTNYTIENVIVSGKLPEGSTRDIVVGSGTGLPIASNVYVITDKCQNATWNKLSSVVEVTSDQLTADWYKNTLGLDLEDESVVGSKSAWVIESDGTIKLRNASSNVIDEAAELVDVKLVTTNAKTYYFYDEEFTSEGLTVIGTFRNPSGVELQAIISTGEADAKVGNYTVDSTTFNKTTAGIYTITVTATKGEVSKTATYPVSVNLLDSIEIVTDTASLVMAQGSDLDASGLIVLGVYSDGTNTKKFGIPTDRFTVDSLHTYDKTTVGKYTITVDASEHNATFQSTYDVEVVPALTAANEITVSVDGSIEATIVDATNNTATFKTINDAMKYLEALYKDANNKSTAIKTVNLAEGVYNEKVYVNLDNVHFVGAESTRTNDVASIASACKFNEAYKTQIIFDAVNGKNLPDLSGKYGSDNSATVYVKANGFQAKNISFINSWDYLHTTQGDNQALALYIQGDKSIVTDCSMHGYQDTVQTKTGRSYFANCYIEGCTDFIYGVNSVTLYENCQINVKLNNRNGTKNESVIFAPKTDEKDNYGYYFNNCKFTYDDNCEKNISIARTWGPKSTIMIMNSNFIGDMYRTNAYDSTNKCRYNKMNGDPTEAHFYEYNNTGDGAIKDSVAGVTVLKDANDLVTKITNKTIFNATEEFTGAFDVTTLNIKPLYAVTYVTNGDSDKITPYRYFMYSANEKAQNVLLTSQKAHHSFAGWYEDKDCTTAYDFNTTLTGDVTLYANWTLNKYELSYVSEKGDVPTAVTEVSQLTDAHLPKLVDETTNFTFGGWYYDEEFTQAAAKDQWLEADTVLYAKWVDPNGSVQTNNYAFSYAAINQSLLIETTAGSKDKAQINQAVFDGTANSFLTVKDQSMITYRTSNNCIEIKGENLTVTFTGTGTFKVKFASTGGSNESWFSLENAAGTALEASNASSLTVATGQTNVYTVTGTTWVEVTYNITTPGTYTLCSNHKSRGCRINTIEIVDRY